MKEPRDRWLLPYFAEIITQTHSPLVLNYLFNYDKCDILCLVSATGGRLGNECGFVLAKTTYLQNLGLRLVHSWHYRVHNFISLQEVQKTEGGLKEPQQKREQSQDARKASLKFLIEMKCEKQVSE